jgi:1,4-alpha-glucan branching enzyme
MPQRCEARQRSRRHPAVAGQAAVEAVCVPYPLSSRAPSTQRLDYLVDRGVDAIWLSPIYRSPMVDFGYDVTHHCDVDPEFGTLADVEARS